ncbi:MAG: response regulator [Ignavibacteriales bacterium]|nr:response regulator [Ignavibacteriales bacterium]
MKKILVVEDETVIRENISDLLETEGFEVLSAEDGLEGYNIAQERLPDLILSDIMMPGMNGLEMLKRLQDNPLTSAIPFIFLSAKVEPQDIREGMTLGADDYLLKPYRCSDLLSAIESRFKKKEKYQSIDELFKSSLVKRVQHELRTPLVSILGLSEMISKDIESLTREELSDMANKIMNSGSRLLRRVEKLLVYAELLLDENGSETLLKTKGNSYQIDHNFLKSRISQKAALFNRANDLESQFENNTVNITDQHYEFIINELVENSIKYSKDGSIINITGESNGKFYRTIVRDTGEGIKLIGIEKISPFNQFGKEDETVEGLGLGLAIVKKIVELNNGYIKIDSKEKSYTAFEFGIPLAK